MWNRTDIDKNKRYCIQFCQSLDRVRYCALKEIDSPTVNPDVLFETGEILNEVLETYNLEEMAKAKLLGDEEFSFDAHGVWLTKAESDAWISALFGPNPQGWKSIPWVNGIEPRFPPK